MTNWELDAIEGKLLAQIEGLRQQLAQAQAEATEWRDEYDKCRAEARHVDRGVLELAASMQKRAEQAEAALAAVPVGSLRRIYEMHMAHQWSSIESPPLYAAFGAWLATQPQPEVQP